VVAALDTLRELSRGLAPPLLESEGLGGALSALARRVPLQVEVRANGERFRREAEAAVYFCCAEALQNVTKHARASRASVSISRVAGHLQFEVHDDGEGFDPAVAAGGTGLQNMRDRLEALGGQLSVHSGASGTRVIGSVPC
jgi:signal transduction histidine kinase